MKTTMSGGVKDSIVSFIKLLDEHLVEQGRTTNLYLAGGAAIVLTYSGIEQTKDVDTVNLRAKRFACSQ